MGLIIIDGLYASGKTTQAEMLKMKLLEEGLTIFLRTHPSVDDFFGNKAHGYLFKEGRNAHLVASLFYLMDVIRSILLYRW